MPLCRRALTLAILRGDKPPTEAEVLYENGGAEPSDAFNWREPPSGQNPVPPGLQKQQRKEQKQRREEREEAKKEKPPLPAHEVVELSDSEEEQEEEEGHKEETKEKQQEEEEEEEEEEKDGEQGEEENQDKDQNQNHEEPPPQQPQPQPQGLLESPLRSDNAGGDVMGKGATIGDVEQDGKSSVKRRLGCRQGMECLDAGCEPFGLKGRSSVRSKSSRVAREEILKRRPC